VNLAVALTLVSALLHAAWNALLRLEPDKERGLVGAVTVGSLLALAVAGIRAALGEALFSSGASLAYTIGAGVFEAVYFVSLARAMERGRLGTVYTISRGGAVLVVWPMSIVLFAEAVTPRSAVGSAVVLAGLVVSSFGIAARASATGPARDPQRERAAIGYAIASAAGIAGYHLCYKAGLRAGGNPSAIFGVSLSLSAVLSAIRLGAAGRRALVALARTRALRLVAMGTLCGGSFLILMEALARSGSGFVLTLRNTSVLFAVILAAMIGDRPRRPEVLGAIAVALGAVLMAS
jgi:uncharacterized membrane protein